MDVFGALTSMVGIRKLFHHYFVVPVLEPNVGLKIKYLWESHKT